MAVVGWSWRVGGWLQIQIMKGKYNSSNDSLFSLEFKIPYEKNSIEEHLEESQEEINFIKIKLTEAYEKLQFEIKANTHLEEHNDALNSQLATLADKYTCERKENAKLKETLELILKNRKLLHEEVEQLKDAHARKTADKDAAIEALQNDLKQLTVRNHALVAEVEDRNRQLKDYSERLREDSLYKDHESQREVALANKIHILEQEITRITEEKYVEVNRLRHELALYHRSPSPAPSPCFREPKLEDRLDHPIDRRREFSRALPRKNLQKFETRASEEESDFNKQNVNSLQVNSLQAHPLPNNSLTESSISKWKKPSSNPRDCQDFSQTTHNSVGSDDQQLTQYQLTRKKAEQELCALEKVKRPSAEERERMGRLEREIYHLDSDIAGLKRKIRRKY